MKEFYSFTVNKKVKTEETINNEDGSITIKPVFTTEPVEIFLKEPSRKDIEEINFIYRAFYGKAVTAGILNKESLTKTIIDNGGIVPEKDSVRANEIRKEIEDISAKIGENPDNDHAESITKLDNLVTELNEIKDIGAELYNKTAEAYADDRSILYTALSFTFYSDKTRVFKGDSQESKLDYYYKISDNPEDYEFELTVLKKSYACYYAKLLMDQDVVTKDYLSEVVEHV